MAGDDETQPRTTTTAAITRVARGTLAFSGAGYLAGLVVGSVRARRLSTRFANAFAVNVGLVALAGLSLRAVLEANREAVLGVKSSSPRSRRDDDRVLALISGALGGASCAGLYHAATVPRLSHLGTGDARNVLKFTILCGIVGLSVNEMSYVFEDWRKTTAERIMRENR